MNRPALYWILFALSLLLIIPAMAWLTWSALELDQQIREDRRQTELARREVELQEKITSALYRMDWKLGPHIAREAAQPYYMYEPFYQLPMNSVQSQGGSEANAIPSPLLYEDAEFVKLHFQVGSEGIFTSPSRPVNKREIEEAANCCNISQSQLLLCDAQLDNLRRFSSFEKICQRFDEDGDNDPSVPSQLELVDLKPQAKDFAEQITASINSQQTVKQLLQSKISKSKLQSMRNRSRGGDEFQKRKSAYDDNTQQWAQQRMDAAAPNGPAFESKQNEQADADASSSRLVEGMMKPIWIEGELLLARKVDVDGKPFVQGCWLDWKKIQSALRDEIEDILPDVRFEPLLSSDQLEPSRALVTLPVQVVVDSPAMLASLALTPRDSSATATSGVPLALQLAWLGLALSAAAIGLLLYGVIRLSERRAAFVSAVTHELRTPLTTFKMYSEMLADDMVPPKKQKLYANTLTQQADRLSHLVENVLQFARLERGTSGTVAPTIILSDELQRIVHRLEQRCEQNAMRLKVETDESVAGQSVRIEPHSLEQILFNLVDNACKYAADAADKTIVLSIGRQGNHYELSVRDFGPGIDPAFRRRLFQAFCKSDQEAANSAAGVGLGLALCRRMASSLGGSLKCVDAQPGAKFVLTIPA